jgi:hypothetical protein
MRREGGEGNKAGEEQKKSVMKMRRGGEDD